MTGERFTGPKWATKLSRNSPCPVKPCRWIRLPCSRRCSFRPVPCHFTPPSGHMLLWCRHHHTPYSIHFLVLCCRCFGASRLFFLHSAVLCLHLYPSGPLLACSSALLAFCHCSLARDAVEFSSGRAYRAVSGEKHTIVQQHSRAKDWARALTSWELQ